MTRGPWEYLSRSPKPHLGQFLSQEEFLKVKWLLKFKVKGTLVSKGLPGPNLGQRLGDVVTSLVSCQSSSWAPAFSKGGGLICVGKWQEGSWSNINQR